MNLVRFFVLRPIGTILFSFACFLGGILGYSFLPVSDLPDVDFPVIMVMANQPGGSPSEIASTIAEPLERHLGAIAGIREITSETTVNQTRILLQFELTRNINDAARDVQAAIIAARQDLPNTLRSNPNFIKANSNGPPIMAFSLTSSTHTTQELYDFANNILTSQLGQVEGVGNVDIKGSSLPAIRVEINPLKLFRYGIGFEDIRAALASANAHTPKGFITLNNRNFSINTNDQATKAHDYKNLIIAYRNNKPVYLSNIAEIKDSSEDLRQAAYLNGQTNIMCTIFAESGSNIVKTTDALKARLPFLRSALLGNTDLEIQFDRSDSVRASLADTQKTLIISVLLVILVVFLFLPNPITTLIPAIIVPLSIVTSFGVMSLLHYQLDTMSLMALTIVTGFVVDDAIVVLENITRYLEMGYPPKEAAIEGAGEVAFTVFSITLSLIIVFAPIFLMSGIAGMFFHEFAMTIVIALIISFFLSLTLTPALCALLLEYAPKRDTQKNLIVFLLDISQKQFHTLFSKLATYYETSLNFAFHYPKLILSSLPLSIIITIIFFITLPKELFPPQDDDFLMGRLIADQSVSFHKLQEITINVQKKIKTNPNIINVMGGLGKRSSNSVTLFMNLKPKSQRKASINEIMQQLMSMFKKDPHITLRLHLPGAIGGGARSTDSTYQYTLQSSDAEELSTWTPRILSALSHLKGLRDITSDTEEHGKEITLFINRDQEIRYNITPQLISNTIYDAFGQRSASIIYAPLDQYRVIMEAAPKFWANPVFLKQMWISASGGTANGGTSSNNLRVRLTESNNSSLSASEISYQNSVANALAGGKSASNGAAVTTSAENMIPLINLGTLKPTNAPLAVNHQGQFVSSTISFNLAPNVALGSATKSIEETLIKLHMPPSIQGSFAGDAATLQKTTSQEPLIILASLAAVYLLLGALYESFLHPITILSTLPSAGVGALWTVSLFHGHFSLLTLIGILLLIGIVKKNAIMLIDFAIIAQQNGASAYDAIHRASLLRFRPIMMTSFAAALGTLPLLLSTGTGSEMRHPLGLAILGGLCLSQLLTLYTTPILYLFLDHLKKAVQRKIRALKQIFYT